MDISPVFLGGNPIAVTAIPQEARRGFSTAPTGSPMALYRNRKIILKFVRI